MTEKQTIKNQETELSSPLGTIFTKLSELHVHTLKELHTVRYTTVQEKENLAKELKSFLIDFIEELESYDKMLENIEQALDKTEKKATRVLKNFKSIRKKFSVLMKKHKVAPITATSGEFVAGLHKVVDVVITEDIPDGHIVRVEREGYFWKGEVLKPAEVIVAKSHAD